MILILEGIDGSGKSTLAEQLSSRLGIPVYNALGTPAEKTLTVDESQKVDAAIVNMLETLRPEVIMDRFFPSEWVYGIARSRGINTIKVMELDAKMSELDALAVLLRIDDPFDLFHRADGHLQDEEDARKIIAKYDDYVKASKMRWIVLDGTKPILDNVEVVMLQVADSRPSKPETYMELARVVSKRSTCLSKHVGAVLLSKSGHVIATGYNGAPKGISHQCDCPRLRNRTPSGADLDECLDVHAEENLIVQAALAGADPTGGTVYTTSSPCRRCMRMLINAQVSKIVYESVYDDPALGLGKEAGIDLVQQR